VADEFARCPLCSSPSQVRFSQVTDPQTLEHFAIYQCNQCHAGHTVPPPGDLGKYYGTAYYGGRHGLTTRFCSWRRLRIVRCVAGSGRGKRLLDVGCGDGTFLLAARDAGWQVAGTELNPQPARSQGLDVRENLDELQGIEPFDCITSWHSLEHLRDPRSALVAARKLLRPGGVLVVAVPNNDGFQARIFGRYWLHLDVPRHLFHFSRESLRRLCESSGFVVTRQWHQEFEYDLLGWSQSALSALLPTPNVFFNLLTGKPSTTGKAAYLINLGLGLLLTAAFVPAVPIASACRRGGTLIVAARLQ